MNADPHERQVVDGKPRFRLLSRTAPVLSIGGATLKLLDAVQPFNDLPEVTLELKVGDQTQKLDLEARQSLALPEGTLTFRYLLDGETSPGVVEYAAHFELAPTDR